MRASTFTHTIRGLPLRSNSSFLKSSPKVLDTMRTLFFILINGLALLTLSERLFAQTNTEVTSYILPPVDSCASIEWKGDKWVELTAINNCPAAIQADLVFNDGMQAGIFCHGYDECKATFPKTRVDQKFSYRLYYATE